MRLCETTLRMLATTALVLPLAAVPVSVMTVDGGIGLAVSKAWADDDDGDRDNDRDHDRDSDRDHDRGNGRDDDGGRSSDDGPDHDRNDDHGGDRNDDGGSSDDGPDHDRNDDRGGNGGDQDRDRDHDEDRDHDGDRDRDRQSWLGVNPDDQEGNMERSRTMEELSEEEEERLLKRGWREDADAEDRS